jgi:hypothetical protein
MGNVGSDLGNVVQMRTVGSVQVPPPPRHFVGRDAELAELGAPLVVLSGPEGVGKTSIASRWLRDRRGEFPGGQFCVDLQAHSPEDVLGWFAADEPFAVLLDNATSAAQVRPLLPASGTVVVTSRSRLDLDGARFVDVGPMDLDDSVRLLERVAGAREPDAARELARLCGGLPIALAVAGARWATRSHPPSTGELPALLHLSYVDLPARQAKLYRLCAWHPDVTFGVEAAAVMADEPVYDVEDALEDLVDKNLLAEAGGDQFRFHDLLRLHARRQPEPEREAAVQRVVEWYRHSVVPAQR